MLKVVQNAAWIAAFAFLVTFVIGMAMTASSQQSPPNNGTQPAKTENRNTPESKTIVNKSTNHDDEKREDKKQWYDTFREHPTDWLLVLFNGLLVCATIALFISGEKVAESAKTSAEAANKSAKVSEDGLLKLQRSFVTFQGMRHLSHIDSDGKVWWSLHFNWFNSGASPARRVRFFVSRYFEDSDLPDDFKFEAPIDRPTNFMGPNSTMQTGGLSVTADDLIAVRENRKFLYFWGRADYRDIFDGSPDHVTKFSMRVRDFRGDPAKAWDDKNNVVEIILDNSPARHNCADEDCN
jgi:hypothetical protein